MSTGQMAKNKKPRRMTQEERTGISDGRMIEAAVQLVLKRGTHKTTLKEIGEKAGYSRGLAGIRFGSKERLFNEMAIVYDRRWKEKVQAFVGVKRGLAAFNAAVDAVEHFLEEQSEHAKAMYLLYYETIGSNPLIRKRLASVHTAYNTDVSHWIAEAKLDGTVRTEISPDRFAVLWSSFVFGLIYQWLVNPEATDVRRSLDDFREMSMTYLAKS
jgi:AcrR family transcriptional regulator